MADAKYLGGNSCLQCRLGEKTYKFAENTPLFLLLSCLIILLPNTNSISLEIIITIEHGGCITEIQEQATLNMTKHLTCITALNQQVFPTFFKPTGHPSCRCRSYGFTGSTNLTQGSPLFLFSPDLFSAKLASKTLKQANQKNQTFQALKRLLRKLNDLVTIPANILFLYSYSLQSNKILLKSLLGNRLVETYGCRKQQKELFGQ